MVCRVTHAEREDDVLDEYPPAPLGLCCPAPLMSLSALDLEVSVSFYKKSITKPLALHLH